MTVTAKARTFGIIGHPVGHSLSPMIHNTWIADLGLDAVYVPLPVAPGGLADAFSGLRALGFSGANITIPHKEEALKLAGRLADSAKDLGAVNTIQISNGEIIGHNTDAAGFMAHLAAAVPDWRAHLRDRTCLVLGAGGAARAVLYGLLKAGCASVTLTNRSGERAAALAAAFNSLGAVRAIPWEDRAAAVSDAGLVVNTTSLGMTGNPPLELDLSAAPNAAIVYDIVYSPLQTPFLKSAAARGLVAVDGLGMLIGQAQAAFEIWFGTRPAVSDNQRAKLLAVLQQRDIK